MLAPKMLMAILQQAVTKWAVIESSEQMEPVERIRRELYSTADESTSIYMRDMLKARVCLQQMVGLVWRSASKRKLRPFFPSPHLLSTLPSKYTQTPKMAMRDSGNDDYSVDRDPLHHLQPQAKPTTVQVLYLSGNASERAKNHQQP